jgi:hypothetical protein
MEAVATLHREGAAPDATTLAQLIELAAAWEAAFEQVAVRIGAHFPRSDVRADAMAYLRGFPRPQKQGGNLDALRGTTEGRALANLERRCGRAQ